MPREERIAYLEGRVHSLETQLENRSRELRRLQQALGPRALIDLSRILGGLPPVPRHAIDIELLPGDVDVVLAELWGSLKAADLGNLKDD